MTQRRLFKAWRPRGSCDSPELRRFLRREMSKCVPGRCNGYVIASPGFAPRHEMKRRHESGTITIKSKLTIRQEWVHRIHHCRAVKGSSSPSSSFMHMKKKKKKSVWVPQRDIRLWLVIAEAVLLNCLATQKRWKRGRDRAGFFWSNWRSGMWSSAASCEAPIRTT